MMPNATEMEFTINGRRLAGKQWGKQGDLPVFALHGWLDNCASFDFIAPKIQGIHCIALDLAGHGLSDHREPGRPYNIWDDLFDLFDIADQLGWSKFSIVGHSRGAIIGMLAAGTIPERIVHLAAIDAFFPMPTDSDQAPKQLAQAILGMKKANLREPTVFADAEAAINARQYGLNPVSYEAARQLATRGMKKVDHGYIWSADPALKAASAVKFDREQINAFVSRISASIVLILAKNGLRRMNELSRSLLDLHPDAKLINLEGGHHLHMENAREEIAEILTAHFAERHTGAS